MAKASTKSGIDTTLDLTAHRRWIGLLGLGLPFMLLLMDSIFPTTHGELESVSAYYYTGGIPVFTGVLFALSGFLITYRGREGDRKDDHVGTLGGIAALVVAIIPTKPPEGVTPPAWWVSEMHKVHLSAAALLFGTFMLFCFWLFPRSENDEERAVLPEKSIRDRVCFGCGVAMVVFLAWVVVANWLGKPFVLPEGLAIVAFAISWLAMSDVPVIVKSRASRARILKPSPAKPAGGE